MTGEVERQLERDYVDARIAGISAEIQSLNASHDKMHDELQRAVDLAGDVTQERVKVALTAIEARLDLLNEFRASLEDSIKNGVSRDIFDIVTNRLTVVENTYLKTATYNDDNEQLRERYLVDLQQRDRRIGDLEKNQIGREHYSLDSSARDKRLTELETNTVRQTALDQQATEVARTRKALVYTVVGGVILTLLNFVINIYQSAHPGT